MKIIYLSSPEFGVPILDRLLSDGHEVVAVVCQPDKVNGRGNKITFGAVKTYALEKGIKVLQYNKIRLEGVEELKALNADVMVTAAYGQLLSQEILDICPFGVVNVHGSILPKYRGASPIMQAIIDGEKQTGITIMKTNIGMDDGPMYLKEYLDIGEHETAGELTVRMSMLGAECLSRVLKQLEDGTATLTEQDHENATVCKKYKKEHTKVDFTKTARDVMNFIHGLSPEPGVYFVYNDMEIKTYNASVVACEEFENAKPGEVVVSSPKKGLIIKCGEGFVSLETIQAPGGKRMRARDYLNGKKIEVGTII